MKSDDIEEMIAGWGKQNQPIVKEIYVIGSRGRNKVPKNGEKKSDLDLMVFMEGNQIPASFYRSLAKIGLKVGLLIHPLFILEKDRKSKLSIKEYSEAFAVRRQIL